MGEGEAEGEGKEGGAGIGRGEGKWQERPLGGRAECESANDVAALSQSDPPRSSYNSIASPLSPASRCDKAAAPLQACQVRTDMYVPCMNTPRRTCLGRSKPQKREKKRRGGGHVSSSSPRGLRANYPASMSCTFLRSLPRQLRRLVGSSTPAFQEVPCPTKPGSALLAWLPASRHVGRHRTSGPINQGSHCPV